MDDVAVIEDPAAAAVALDPVRARLLAALAKPASAAALAAEVGLPRQKVNYHLRALEAHGLLRVAEERRHGGLTERVLQATAASYVVSPAALGEPATPDRLSARYLIALAARLLREVDGKQPTLGLDAEVRLRDRARFAEDLTQAVTQVIARHHHDDGVPHRLVVAAHPLPKEDR